MPNLTVAVYLTDKEYVKYVKNKKPISVLIKKTIRDYLGIEERPRMSDDFRQSKKR
jgi:hypothetical protein